MAINELAERIFASLLTLENDFTKKEYPYLDEEKTRILVKHSIRAAEIFYEEIYKNKGAT